MLHYRPMHAASLPSDRHAPIAGEPILDLHGIGKSFPGVRALHDVSLSVGRGEVLALVGENGAGKSTLMRIIAGILPPDAGEIRLNGRVVELASPRDATALGVALIHQEISILDNLDIASNIFLGREPLSAAGGFGGGLLRRAGWLDGRRMRGEAGQWLRRVGLSSSPLTPVSELSLGQKQLVEIARALSIGARILLMDEPTSSLSAADAERLFDLIGELRDGGVSVLYISHRLGEVQRVADRVAVLRDGKNAGELTGGDIRPEAIIARMVGRELASFGHRSSAQQDRVRLRVSELRLALRPGISLSLELRAGEIVGVAGLVGAGRSRMARALVGLEPVAGGRVLVDGVDRRIDGPRAAVAAGVVLVPEDRKAQGLVLDMSVRENLTLPRMGQLSRVGLIDRRREKRESQAACERLGVRTPSIEQATRLLSGGNQQKVALGKWLDMRPAVLILDEPTRGVDVGARAEIYRLIDALLAEGAAVLMISSEMEEILGMSDRVLVMHEGRIAGALARREADEESIMRLATGQVGRGA
ncbi:MAG: Ribose import ATP-binding protein RbsA [Phycisphaerae bacterium]|nr:Ribose import ATP-binding protein RbsA [Phycisphaerae bacterium]